MIIKIIPEKGETHIKAVEHHNVKEFLIFGNKKDGDGELIDFHDWSGQYRYLIGSLHYFKGLLNNEQTAKTNPVPQYSMPNIEPQGMIKHIASEQPNLQILNMEEADVIEDNVIEDPIGQEGIFGGSDIIPPLENQIEGVEKDND